MIQDIRFALRLLWRNPAFAAVAIATLALGIGINTAAFTFFNAFILRPLPIRDPEELVKLNAVDRNGRIQGFSIAEYRDFRDRNDVFSGVIALDPLPVSLGDAVAGREATDYSIIPPGYQFAFGLTVSGNYFAVLGGQPAVVRHVITESAALGVLGGRRRHGGVSLGDCVWLSCWLRRAFYSAVCGSSRRWTPASRPRICTPPHPNCQPFRHFPFASAHLETASEPNLLRGASDHHVECAGLYLAHHVLVVQSQLLGREREPDGLLLARLKRDFLESLQLFHRTGH